MIGQGTINELLTNLKEFVELPNKTLEYLRNMETKGEDPRNIEKIRNDCKKMYRKYNRQWVIWEGLVKDGCPSFLPEERLKFIAVWDQLEAKLKQNLATLRNFFNEH